MVNIKTILIPTCRTKKLTFLVFIPSKENAVCGNFVCLSFWTTYTYIAIYVLYM